MARPRKAQLPSLCVNRSPAVHQRQGDKRRLTCRSCGASERMGEGEMPPKTEVIAQFRWVQAYNEQVEGFLAAHSHEEVI